LKQLPVHHHVSLSVDRMEAGVLGTKRTIPFWRAKRPLLAVERALLPMRRLAEKAAMTAPALAAARARGRLQAASKQKGRFTER
jgi:hypothetical protein